MSGANTVDAAVKHTPPLGHQALTPLYDLAIAALTRESVWRTRFIREIAPKAQERILDIGSGTGSLAVALWGQIPGIKYVGVDPDIDAVRRARNKTAKAGADVRFVTGFFSGEEKYFDQPPDKIISSLVLHQVPIAEKQRIINVIYQSLRTGGPVHIADYGFQRSAIMRVLFRITVQALDGVADTQPNADGILPEILNEAGFEGVTESTRIPTPTGTISIYSGQKPGSRP